MIFFHIDGKLFSIFFFFWSRNTWKSVNRDFWKKKFWKCFPHTHKTKNFQKHINTPKTFPNFEKLRNVPQISPTLCILLFCLKTFPPSSTKNMNYDFFVGKSTFGQFFFSNFAQKKQSPLAPKIWTMIFFSFLFQKCSDFLVWNCFSVDKNITFFQYFYPKTFLPTKMSHFSHNPWSKKFSKIYE